jgi:hypothetical protein
MRRSFRPLVAAVCAVAGSAAIASSAMAAAPTGDFTDFKYCPYTNAAVNSCVYSTVTSGSFKLGNANVPINKTITLQGGIQQGFPADTWFNAAQGGATLSKTPLDVPGGLIGLVDTGGFGGLLISLFNAAVSSVNAVTATAELAGPVGFSFFNFLIGTDPAVTLPVRIHLENPFLGSSCYVGSTSNPVNLALITGTTAPPPPNTPITGSLGNFTYNSDGSVTTINNNKLVNNSFSVPAASNCGFLPLDKILITAAVNLKEGFPSAAGKNTAILQGTTKVGDRALTQASVH